jgi:putative SOS response-associated peptidase YedK
MKKVIVNEFNVYEVATDVKPDYNITPGRLVLCVVKNGHNKLVSFRWGVDTILGKRPANRV